MKVVTADDDSALHLGGQANTLQDTATDGHVSGERALLVDVSARSLLGGLEAKADILDEPSRALVARSLGTNEHAVLLLESLLVLRVYKRDRQ